MVIKKKPVIRGKLRQPCMNVPIALTVHSKLIEAAQDAKIPIYAIASEAIDLMLENETLWKSLIRRLLKKQQQGLIGAGRKRKQSRKIVEEIRESA